MMSATVTIIQAEGIPLGAILVTAAPCLPVRPSRPDMDTRHRPAVSRAIRTLKRAQARGRSAEHDPSYSFYRERAIIV